MVNRSTGTRRHIGQPVDVYTWRNSIMSQDGPPNPTARLVLMAISLHMKADGSGAWPSQALIASRSATGERSVRRHVEIAERHGWLGRVKIRTAGGRSWYRSEYTAMVPNTIYDALPERPWETDPKWRRVPATVAATHEREPTSTGQSKHEYRPMETRVPATVAATHEREPTSTGQSKHEYRPMETRVPATVATSTGHCGRLTLPLNSSENSSHEGALTCTAHVENSKTAKAKSPKPDTSAPRTPTASNNGTEPKAGSARKADPDLNRRIRAFVASLSPDSRVDIEAVARMFHVDTHTIRGACSRDDA